MTHTTQSAAGQVRSLVSGAYEAAAAAGRLPAGVQIPFPVEIPKNAAHGDYSAAFALAAAGVMKRRPLEIAGILLEHLDLTGSCFASAGIAGAGFLNFRLGAGWYAGVLSAIESEGARYGYGSALAGQRILVESVPAGTASPAGVRSAVCGEALSNLLEANGAEVRRSFLTDGAADPPWEGFDRIVRILDADRQLLRQRGGDGPSSRSAERLDIVLGPVRLLRRSEAARSDGCAGNAVSPGDLPHPVSMDALRWFLSAAPDKRLDFDPDIAVREDGVNPFYRVQYALARSCSLLRALEAEGISVPSMADVDMALLSGDPERALIKLISRFRQVTSLASQSCDPGCISRYLVELADCFHQYRRARPIRGQAPAVLSARLKLADAVRTVLKTGLHLLGIAAPARL